MKILWGSEQPTRPTGYAVVTREIIKRLVERGHEVHCIGWDYNGEPFKHEEGWTMLHAGLKGFGAERLGNMNAPTVLENHLMTIKPDIYVSLIDPWFIGHAVLSTNHFRVPYAAYLPIDGFPISYAWKDILKMLHTPIWMSEFGANVFGNFVHEYSSLGRVAPEMKEPILDRYLTDVGRVIYHGVDVEKFHPITEEEKEEAKQTLGVSEFDFLFLSVAKNTNRKQYPRLLEAFSLMLEMEGIDREKTGLLIHCGDAVDSMGMNGWNLPLLAQQLGIGDNVRFTDVGNPLYGMTPEQMALMYALSDVHVLSTGGEGFGVPTAESMACGVPVILPDNSTGPELVGAESSPEVSVGQRGWLVPCVTHITGPKWGVNMKLVDVHSLAIAMHHAYSDESVRTEMGRNSRDFAVESLDWEKIVDQFEAELQRISDTPHPLGENARR